MVRFAHVVNPVVVSKGSDLFFAQPITFESMRQAQFFASGKVNVKLFSIHYAEDVASAPQDFFSLPNLSRSIRDVANLPEAKKLPLIKDILCALFDNTDAEYLIYTNTDIILGPSFYVSVAQLIERNSFDAISINRRRIPFLWKHVEDLPTIVAQQGKLHPGYDCFVFHRKILEKFHLGNVCIGTGFTSVALIHNLIAFAENPLITDRLHLTFHLGLEVMPPLEQSVYRFTRTNYKKEIYPKLKPHLELKKFPYNSLPFHKRLLKWALNPNFSTAILVELEGKNMKRKAKGLADELRFGLMEKTDEL